MAGAVTRARTALPIMGRTGRDSERWFLEFHWQLQVPWGARWLGRKGASLRARATGSPKSQRPGTGPPAPAMPEDVQWPGRAQATSASVHNAPSQVLRGSGARPQAAGAGNLPPRGSLYYAAHYAY